MDFPLVGQHIAAFDIVLLIRQKSAQCTVNRVILSRLNFDWDI